MRALTKDLSRTPYAKRIPEINHSLSFVPSPLQQAFFAYFFLIPSRTHPFGKHVGGLWRRVRRRWAWSRRASSNPFGEGSLDGGACFREAWGVLRRWWVHVCAVGGTFERQSIVALTHAFTSLHAPRVACTLIEDMRAWTPAFVCLFQAWHSRGVSTARRSLFIKYTLFVCLERHVQLIVELSKMSIFNFSRTSEDRVKFTI